MDDNIEIYKGNIFWLLSVKKKITKDSIFNLKYNDENIVAARANTISSKSLF